MKPNKCCKEYVESLLPKKDYSKNKSDYSKDLIPRGWPINRETREGWNDCIDQIRENMKE